MSINFLEPLLGSRDMGLKMSHNLALSRCYEVQWLCVLYTSPSLSITLTTGYNEGKNEIIFIFVY